MADRRTKAPGGSRGPSQRQLRAGELVRHALSEALIREEIHDEVLAGTSVTVSEVRMSPDLRQATCFVLPLAGRETTAVLAALKRLAPWLGSLVAKRVQLKFAPRLRFEQDVSFEAATRIGNLLHSRSVARDLSPPASDDRAEDDDGA